MKKISFVKAVLVVLVIAILGFGLSGCVVPPITNTGTAKLVVSGTYYYNLKMDGTTYFTDKAPGTYYIYDISPGYHEFEAVDVDGPDWGQDSVTAYISAGNTTTIYLDPAPTVTTGTLKVTIMDDPGYEYDVYAGGNQTTGVYKGTTTGSSVYGANSVTLYNIPTGSQTIFVIASDEEYSKYTYPYINSGYNTLNIWVR